ncbi:hypothetical protein TCAL_04248 [Tigriopus californicus]|uniref:Potassium channel domain-containing protein n=1 Tax=Tigriopus californicus TaxID=6832 RepID=A0A553PKL8_TIGCA|nr:potassium channel subfamily K member 1-like [Tigriopus californicus]TRY78230.1 hypothetical protein TCAL_04248 [Tigriopus californicus]
MATYDSIRSDNQAELDSLSAKSSAGVYGCGYRYRKWFGVRRSTWFLLFYAVTYAAFLVAAGYAMACLEWENEQFLKAQIHELKSTFLSGHPSVNRTELEVLLEASITARDRGISILDKNRDEVNWSYGQSLLYTVTVVTTIGYGHIVPLTSHGKSFTIVFAILGIPFTLVFLTAVVQRLLEPTCQLLSCFFSCLGERWRPLWIRLIHLTFMSVFFICFFIMVPAVIFMKIEETWNYLDGIYFVFISLTTIGLGDYIPGDQEGQRFREVYKTFVAIYLLMGLVFMTLTATVFYDIPQLNLGTMLHQHKDIKLEEDTLEERPVLRSTNRDNSNSNSKVSPER